jgi:hypothetical protein
MPELCFGEGGVVAPLAKDALIDRNTKLNLLFTFLHSLHPSHIFNTTNST